MPIGIVNTVFGLIDGSRLYETPGALVDLESYEPILFDINPRNQTRTKALHVVDHVIPGRHAPAQQPMAGGAEKLTLELILTGTSDLALAAIVQVANWLESCGFPVRGGLIDAIGQSIASGVPSRAANQVSSVGRRVALSYGLWIPERPFLIREVTTKTGPAQHPKLLLPYRAVVTLTLQEDEIENVDYLSRRFALGLPI